MLPPSRVRIRNPPPVSKQNRSSTSGVTVNEICGGFELELLSVIADRRLASIEMLRMVTRF